MVLVSLQNPYFEALFLRGETPQQFTVKNWQRWFYRKKYGNNILGFNLNLQLNTIISLTDIMLIYQSIEVLKSVSL